MDGHPSDFLAFVASESYVSPTERAWERFAAKVEKQLGHSLDGNQDSDGYSLDDAYAAFEASVTVDQYVAEVRTNTAALATVLGTTLPH